MAQFSDELLAISARLRQVGEIPAELTERLDRLEDVAGRVGQAWSGSSLGYHSRIYYADLQPPPPGARFSVEWGFMPVTFDPGRTVGEWREYDPDEVRDAIYATAQVDDLDDALELRRSIHEFVEQARADLLSLMIAIEGEQTDGFITSVRESIEGLTVLTEADAQRVQIRSGQIMTRDTAAAGAGFVSAPHQDVIARVVSIRSTARAATDLASAAERVAAHLERLERRGRRGSHVAGELVFIGHGRSPLWRELKDFVQDRLQLPCDEFNRVPVAGHTNVQRLVQMLDDACFAFLVLTAEDEDADGGVHARLNVVHEAGLFQGRLGFTRAIVMLEEGCAEYSNIEGLGQIRFPAGNIAASFEEVRRVLEREGLVSPP